MPRATVNLAETQTKDLKTLPEAFVTFRRMSYGQIIQRRAMMKVSIEASARSKDFKGEMAMASREIAQFEFQTVIVDHNLETEDGRKLNFASPVDFDSLDPQVGQEIEKYITEMNDFEDEDQEN